jgi:hypothetical protein
MTRCREDGRGICRPLALRHQENGHTFFLYCLWMASSASLMVTPFMFRAVTSSPSGKCRSIFLMRGRQRGFFRMSLSSIVAGDVLIFLQQDDGVSQLSLLC